jgi:ADP-ribose pyrophosphatase YjhB (NUDIX family)
MNRRIAVRGVALHEGKLLCVKLKAYGGKEAREFWCTPGGGVDTGESLLNALHREMIEETGVSPQIGKLLYIQQFPFEGEEQLEFFFEIINAPDYLTPKLQLASHAAQEISRLEFIDPKTHHILPEFFANEDIEVHIAQSGAPKIFSYL